MKSAASLSIARPDGRPAPPAELSDRQKAIWVEITTSKPDAWFDAGTFPLLRALVAHAETLELLECEMAGLGDLDDDADRRYWICKLLPMRALETGCIASLSTKLRLTPQSRYTPQRAAGAASRYTPRPPGENRFNKIALKPRGAKKK
jgi:hypothetical protein